MGGIISRSRRGRGSILRAGGGELVWIKWVVEVVHVSWKSVL